MAPKTTEQETRKIGKLLEALQRQPHTPPLIERAHAAIKSLEDAKGEPDFPKELTQMLNRLKSIVPGEGLAA